MFTTNEELADESFRSTKYLGQHDFRLIQTDTDSMYMAILSKTINDIIRPELREEYDHGGKAEFLSSFKYYNRPLGLFKAKFLGTKIIALMSKCYYAEHGKAKPKTSCKVVRKKNRIQCLWRDL